MMTSNIVFPAKVVVGEALRSEWSRVVVKGCTDIPLDYN